jgi:hypothetical protein
MIPFAILFALLAILFAVKVGGRFAKAALALAFISFVLDAILIYIGETDSSGDPSSQYILLLLSLVVAAVALILALFKKKRS